MRYVQCGIKWTKFSAGVGNLTVNNNKIVIPKWSHVERQSVDSGCLLIGSYFVIKFASGFWGERLRVILIIHVTELLKF
jgi:hypothetical protein